MFLSLSVILTLGTIFPESAYNVSVAHDICTSAVPVGTEFYSSQQSAEGKKKDSSSLFL